MANFIQDLRLALRQLRSRPLFALTAILTLAIGIGVNAVAFTVVNGLIFRKPAHLSERVGRILTTPAGDEGGYASPAELARFADATRGAVDIAAEGRLTVAWQHDGHTQTAWVLLVSPNYFSMVDVQPLAGRLDVDKAAGDAAASVVIGERFWRRSLGSPSLAGLTLRLNNNDANVVGVLPDSFTGPAGLYSPDVWLPLDDRASFRTAAGLEKPDTRWLFVMGRLLPGVGVPELQARIDAAVAGMAHDWPESHRQRGARFRMLGEGNSELRGLTRAAAIVMGIIGLVLLLACFNVANLLLARAVERQREMGIRTALGAGTARLVRLVVTEGLVIATFAGVAAAVVAYWTQALIGSFAMPIDEPQHIDFTLDGRVFGFVALLVMIAGVVPGLWPALASARVDPSRVLASQGGSAMGGRPSPMRRWLVAAQVAGSTAFLAIAALVAQTYSNLSLADFGFDSRNLVIAEFAPAAHGYDADRSARYVSALQARIRALPGISDVAIAARAPFFIGFDRRIAVSSLDAPCDADACVKIPVMAVAPGYFRTMGISLTQGRDFGGNAVSEVIINQPLAARYWTDGRAVGETLRIGDHGAPATVVGMTAKTHTRGLDREEPTLYVPLELDDFEHELTMIARTAGAASPLVRPVSEAAQTLDPNVSMTSIKTMEQRMAMQLWPFKTVGRLFSICGGLALILATVGLAGVVIYTVNRRLREFGVRLAVGARPRDLVFDVLAGSARLMLPGLLGGTLLAAALARLARVAFYGVNVLNPTTYAGVALLECVIVIIACVSPALRAARIDPIAALRSE